MTEPLTPHSAQVRLAQYGERTGGWSTATYDSGTEKALHEIALTLNAEVDRLRGDRETEVRRESAAIVRTLIPRHPDGDEADEAVAYVLRLAAEAVERGRR